MKTIRQPEIDKALERWVLALQERVSALGKQEEVAAMIGKTPSWMSRALSTAKISHKRIAELAIALSLLGDAEPLPDESQAGRTDSDGEGFVGRVHITVAGQPMSEWSIYSRAVGEPSFDIPFGTDIQPQLPSRKADTTERNEHVESN